MVISSLINSDNKIAQIDDQFTEKINDFLRVFSHLSFNHNPRLGLLFFYLYSNDQLTPDLFCQKIISLVNPNSTKTRVEEVDVYLFSLWLLRQNMSEQKIERYLSEKSSLSKILQASTSDFKDYFYSKWQNICAQLMNYFTSPKKEFKNGNKHRLETFKRFIHKRGITEISINGLKTVFVEREGKLIQLAVELNNEDISEFVQDLENEKAQRVGIEYSSSPILNTNLEDGSRVNVIKPPFTQETAAVSIRKYLQEN